MPVDNVPTAGWTVELPQLPPDEQDAERSVLHKEAQKRAVGNEIAASATALAILANLVPDMSFQDFVYADIAGHAVDLRAVSAAGGAFLLTQAVRLVASHDSYRVTRAVAHAQLDQFGNTEFPAERSARLRRTVFLASLAVSAAAGATTYGLIEDQPFEDSFVKQLAMFGAALGAAAFFKVKGIIARRSLR